MRSFTKYAAQGDFLIMKIDDIPSDVVPLPVENGKYVIAHSETGHNHVMEREGVEAYKKTDTKEVDLYELFMVVKEPSQIDHLRSFDTHESIKVEPGNYVVKRQREYTAEGFRRAAD